MPLQDRKSRGPNRSHQKTKDKELLDLKRLLSMITAPISKQASSLSQSKGHKSQTSTNVPEHRKNATEASELENFSVTYRKQRYFNDQPHHRLFLDIFTALINNRLGCSDWLENSSSDNVLRVLNCLRLLIRDPLHQKAFFELQGASQLVKHMESVASVYLECGEQTLEIEQLVAMTYIFQKLSTVEEQRQWIINCEAHKTLVKLLSTRDCSVVLGALLALTTLAESQECKEKIGELSVVEHLLDVLQDYDMLSKRLSAELLRLLCSVQCVRDQLRQCDGVPVLLSLLHSEHIKLLWSTVWVLVQLCQDPDTSAEVRAWGGVQQLLRILHGERVYVSDRSTIDSISSANAAGRIHSQQVSAVVCAHETAENTISLQSACCAAITELVLDDTTAHNVVQENGVYIIAKLILPQNGKEPQAKSLQCYAFRALRFLFSMERNRHHFKRLFSPDLFEMFIDVGHYVRDITAYEPLQQKIMLLSPEELDILRESIETVNQNRPPIRVVNGYAVLEHLGSGAFGSVFKVRKQNGQNILALKEVNFHNPAFGKDKRSRDSSVEKIVSEMTIIKEQMSHPNIVKYFKTFLEGDKLYIVMELIEGAPLAEHFSSLKEKKQTFTEERVWNIFIQICLALRYLHKEKRIIHRDLTPNNIMLGERDKVTITDFGLAKQKQENSKLTSVVGTILYCCPEIVKNEPYGEKADVWAAGCILYQTVTLNPPFYSANMLSLATKIVEAVYEPLEDKTFSERVTDMIKWCLTPNADVRPDIIEVSSRISDIMMRFVDSLCVSHNALERRAERDRKRAQKYFLESNRTRMCGPIQQGLSLKNQDESQSESFETSTSVLVVGGEQKQSQVSQCGVKGADELNMSSGDFQKPKARPASAGICLSQRKVRQIDDPNQRLLELLHKIIFITQLPPAPQNSFKQRAIERFKKSLFIYGSDAYNLKVELNKVLQGSQELVEMSSASREWWSMIQSLSSDPSNAENRESGYSSLQDGLTYEDIQSMVEDVLEENGYYSRRDLDSGAATRQTQTP
ncbi:serine/threonine-protein kinase Nek10 [Danio rerio]|uniref:Serine/threonine-protein kinase Nek10 n=1 Tax=Danio rerio TaxID=7955 RepID=A0A8M3AJH8_DANRE|nr:serine/threonine-protein kinase Nek10 isoform X1 [Danio rerio]|eukprot:XP_009290963.1 serine/threonine-protein kinase Nek10 isoform X1 [Danio rerio]